MSADEIRRLAESCRGKANYYASMTPCSDLKHDRWYRDSAKAESDKAAAILAFAAMVERCERLLGCTFYLEDGHTNIDHIIKPQINYILKGATDERK